MEVRSMRISVIGLGKLGLPLAVCFAAKGFSVIGCDSDAVKIQAINQGTSPIYEPRLQELIAACGNKLAATSDYAKALMESDVTFILVPTPSRKEGGFSLQYVLDAARRLGECLRNKKQYHLIVLTSTVMPQSTENELKPVLEEYSQKRCGQDFGLCYNPEFVALGSVIDDLLNPDFILIGESDARAGAILADLYASFCENSPPVARMNFVNAELTKLAVNTFVTTKISFANTLARMCEFLPGADVSVVTHALGLDGRIGGHYLKGAIGYGGPCFPRDNLALADLARILGVPAILAEATDIFNRQQVYWLMKLTKSHLSPEGKVGVLGLAYKPNSDVVEESVGLLLAQALAREGVSTCVFDPVAMGNARKVLKDSVSFAGSIRECIEKAEVLVVVTPWKEFAALTPEIFIRDGRSPVVIDCWRIMENIKSEAGITYIPLGIGGLYRRINK